MYSTKIKSVSDHLHAIECAEETRMLLVPSNSRIRYLSTRVRFEAMEHALEPLTCERIYPSRILIFPAKGQRPQLALAHRATLVLWEESLRRRVYLSDSFLQYGMQHGRLLLLASNWEEQGYFLCHRFLRHHSACKKKDSFCSWTMHKGETHKYFAIQLS